MQAWLLDAAKKSATDEIAWILGLSALVVTIGTWVAKHRPRRDGTVAAKGRKRP
jgi:hypothetical protein